MASVNTVYQAVKNLANKDQQGFITPVEFNSFAEIAQRNIYNGLFDEFKDVRRMMRAGFNPARDKSKLKRLEEDLSKFARVAVLDKDSTTGAFLSSSIGDSVNPNDPLQRIISITTGGSILLGNSTRTPIELCYDEDKIERVLLSDISKPTESFPVALISENIEVFPSSIQKIRVRYYKSPTSINVSDGSASPSPPRYAVSTTNGTDTFDSTTSRDFELPDHYTNLLIAEIAQMAGVNMRDGDVMQYGQGQEASTKSEGSF